MAEESTGGDRVSFAPMPQSLTPLVASDDHLAHSGLIELLAGREVPCFESPERAIVIRDALLATGSYELVAPEDHGPDPIATVHELELIDLVEHVWDDAVADGRDPARPLLPDTFLLGAYPGRMELGSLPRGRHDRLGAYCFDTATPIVAGTAAAARAAVDIALTALDRVLDGAPLAYGLCRPPGHHAGRNLIGGYCFYNNAAIAAEAVLARGAERVAILDVDFHHGNGTQQIFYTRSDVLFASIHADPAHHYPHFMGYADERGADDGLGFNLNLPLPPGTGDEPWLQALDTALEAIRSFAPSYLVVSAGFDTFEGDPVAEHGGAFTLTVAAYPETGRRIAALGIPTLFVQEGGYGIAALGQNAAGLLGGFERG